MAAKKDLLLVTSKISGTQANPLPELKKILHKHKVSFTAKSLKTPPEIQRYIKEHHKEYKDIAVYGGDGSIVAGIEALIEAENRLLVLPGGTANTIAGELSLPANAVEIIQMYAEKRYVTDYFDIASLNNEPLTLDMHAGWWTNAIIETSRSLKKRFGPVAYGMSALKKLPAAKKHTYIFTVDGRRIQTTGYTILIANRGQQGFLGITMFPQKHKQGIMQVAVVKSVAPPKILLWLIGRIFNKNIGSAIRTYRGHKIALKRSPKTFIVDDEERKLRLPLTLTGAVYAVKVIVAPQPATGKIVKKLKFFAVVNVVRFKERLRNIFTGEPAFDYSQITPWLYVGGAYRQSAYQTFKQWGVTGIVNMRSTAPQPAAGFDILHLKTRDWTPPSLEDFARGVAFIDEKVAAGGNVYVHCRQGEGRGPSMAAAYLISHGLSVEEALSILRKGRPMARPNRSQVRQLARWQNSLAQTD